MKKKEERICELVDTPAESDPPILCAILSCPVSLTEKSVENFQSRRPISRGCSEVESTKRHCGGYRMWVGGLLAEPDRLLYFML